jgi:hypothetical protein
MSKVSQTVNQDTLSKAFGQAMGARTVELMQMPEFGLKQKYALHAVWDIALETQGGPQGIVESFSDFWERATAVIQIPKVAELQTKLRHAEDTIQRLLQEKANLQKYKDAWELSK